MSTICITGATSGIGRATLERFVREGWKAIAVGRRKERLEELKEAYPESVVAVIPLDVRDRKAVFTALSELESSLAEPISVLVNNAGLALGLDPVQCCDVDDWENMVDTNIKGLLYCTRALLPGMVQRGAGHVVNIGSIAGSWPYPGGNVYGATKSFVLQFSRNLRCDLHGTGIRVTNIEPGLLETEFSLVRFKGDEGRAATVYEGTEPLTAADIANIVWFAVSVPAHVNINHIEVMPVCQSLGSTRVCRK